MSAKPRVFDFLKNIPGPSTKDKIVVFSVDDFGNIRLGSKRAREKMDAAGLKIYNRFDKADGLESRRDLEMLFEVLDRHRDSENTPACFTAFANPCNLNHEAIRQNGFQNFVFERLPKTYERYEANFPDEYGNTWALYKEGIERGLLIPEFHGREHLSLHIFYDKLRKKARDLKVAIENDSYTSLDNSSYNGMRYTETFSFTRKDQTNDFQQLLISGLSIFEEVFGRKSHSFTAPSQLFPKELEQKLSDLGIKAFNRPLFEKRFINENKTSWELNFNGKKLGTKLYAQTRNVIFEPGNGNKDHVGYALKQIERAFSMGKPANISSHRINFSGAIDNKVRKAGIIALNDLLSKIVKKWPDVKFKDSMGLHTAFSKSA